VRRLSDLLDQIKRKKQFRFYKHTILVNWVLSYVFILLIALWSGYITYTISIDVIETEAGKNNYASLQQLKLLIDSRLKDIENIGVEVSLDKKLQNILYQDKPMTEYQQYLLTEIITNLHNYKVVNNFIEDINVYLPFQDLVIRNASLYSTEDWYNIYYKSEALPYNQFILALKQKHGNDYECLMRKSPEGTAAKYIQYRQSLPIDPYGNPYATLVINMKQSVIREYLNNYDWVPRGGSIFIIDDREQVISSVGEMKFPNYINYSYLMESANTFKTRQETTDYVVLHAKSAVTQWAYVFVMPTSVFFEKLERVRAISTMSIIGCMVLGILLTIYFARKNYSPIGNMVNTFSKLGGVEKDMRKNEYGYIESSLEKIMKDREEILRKMDRQRHVLRNTFLAGMLRGRLGRQPDILGSWKEYELDFTEGDFAVLLIHIRDLHNLFFENAKDIDPNNLDLVHFIIRNIFEEQARMCNAGYIIELDSVIACVINIRLEDENAAKAELFRIARESADIISGKFGIELIVAISRVYPSAQKIPDAYAEALETMEYQRLTGDHPVMEYERIGFMHESNPVNDFQEEKRFKNCIEGGDFLGAKDVLNRIFNRNFYNDKGMASVQLMKFKMYALISLVLACVHELTARYDSVFLQNINPESRFLNCDTLVKLQKEMILILDYVETYVKSKAGTRNDSLVGIVTHYIQENYTDSNLNVSTISDMLNVTVPYLSKAFKKKTGRGLLEYIHQVRIEHAKGLLKDKELSVKDIAEKTGYYNAISFIRVFKKFEGVSPGRYGRSSAGEQEAEEL
jgi:two-component system, response regulator YesN